MIIASVPGKPLIDTPDLLAAARRRFGPAVQVQAPPAASPMDVYVVLHHGDGRSSTIARTAHGRSLHLTTDEDDEGLALAVWLRTVLAPDPGRVIVCDDRWEWHADLRPGMDAAAVSAARVRHDRRGWDDDDPDLRDGASAQRAVGAAAGAAPANLGPEVLRYLVSALAVRTASTLAMVFTDDQSHHVDVVTCPDAPAPGTVTVSTVTLHAHPNVLGARDVRVELLLLARDTGEDHARVLGSAALKVVTDSWACAPGIVFPGILRHFLPHRATEHLLLVEPDEPALSRVRITSSTGTSGDTDVHWLRAVPVHESERHHAADHGHGSLLRLLARAGADLTDLDREAVV